MWKLILLYDWTKQSKLDIRDWCITSETGLFFCISNASNLPNVSFGHLIFWISCLSNLKNILKGPNTKMNQFLWARWKFRTLSNNDHLHLPTILQLEKCNGQNSFLIIFGTISIGLWSILPLNMKNAQNFSKFVSHFTENCDMKKKLQNLELFRF